MIHNTALNSIASINAAPAVGAGQPATLAGDGDFAALLALGAPGVSAVASLPADTIAPDTVMFDEAVTDTAASSLQSNAQGAMGGLSTVMRQAEAALEPANSKAVPARPLPAAREFEQLLPARVSRSATEDQVAAATARPAGKGGNRDGKADGKMLPQPMVDHAGSGQPIAAEASAAPQLLAVPVADVAAPAPSPLPPVQLLATTALTAPEPELRRGETLPGASRSPSPPLPKVPAGPPSMAEIRAIRFEPISLVRAGPKASAAMSEAPVQAAGSQVPASLRSVQSEAAPLPAATPALSVMPTTAGHPMPSPAPEALPTPGIPAQGPATAMDRTPVAPPVQPGDAEPALAAVAAPQKPVSLSAEPIAQPSAKSEAPGDAPVASRTPRPEVTALAPGPAPGPTAADRRSSVDVSPRPPIAALAEARDTKPADAARMEPASLRETAKPAFSPTPYPGPASGTMADPAAGLPQAMTSAGPAQPTVSQRPQDFDTLVSRLNEAREAAAPHVVRTAFEHAEFGRVALQMAPGESGLNVTLSSRDADFGPAVQAAALAVAATSAAFSDQLRQDDRPSQQQPSYQQGQQPLAQSGSQGSGQNQQGQPRPDLFSQHQQQRREGAPARDDRQPQGGASARQDGSARNDRQPRGGLYA